MEIPVVHEVSRGNALKLSVSGTSKDVGGVRKYPRHASLPPPPPPPTSAVTSRPSSIISASSNSSSSSSSLSQGPSPAATSTSSSGNASSSSWSRYAGDGGTQSLSGRLYSGGTVAGLKSDRTFSDQSDFSAPSHRTSVTVGSTSGSYNRSGVSSSSSSSRNGDSHTLGHSSATISNLAEKDRDGCSVGNSGVKFSEDRHDLQVVKPQAAHSRLPSTDSGIQADAGGFDSLSRYRGKHFLHTTSGSDYGSLETGSLSRSSTALNDSAVSSSTSTSSLSTSSSGYGGSNSAGGGGGGGGLGGRAFLTQPRASPRKLMSSPLASSCSNTPVSMTSSCHESATTSLEGSMTSSSRNVRGVKEATPPGSGSKSDLKSGSSAVRTARADVNHRPRSSGFISASQLPPPPPPPSSSSSSSSSAAASSSSQNPPQAKVISLSPGLQVSHIPGGVHLSITKSSGMSISQAPPTTSSTSHAPRASALANEKTVSSVSDTVRPGLASGNSARTRGSSPSANSSNSAGRVRIQVVNRPAAFSPLNAVNKGVGAPGHPATSATSKGEGQTRPPLTKPLRIATPSKVNARSVPARTLGPQPTMRPAAPKQQQQQQQQHQQQQHMPSAETKASTSKPTASPRRVFLSSAATKTDAASCSSNNSNSTAASSMRNSTSTSSSTTTTTATTSTPSITVSQSSPIIRPASSTGYKTEIPVVHHRPRKEIPVKRMDSYSSSYRSPTTSYFIQAFMSPERSFQNPIYENVQSSLASSSSSSSVASRSKHAFAFTDPEAQLKHAELVLKESDELINDALKILNNNSPSDSGRVSNGRIGSPLPVEERIVEGSDHGVTSEVAVPIYDVRTGKMYGSSLLNDIMSEVSARGFKKDASWKERKERMDKALSWLKQELAGLRDMDNTLIGQFRRCQDSIEALKHQRESAWDSRECWDGLSEEGDEADYWDDLEINEFNKRFLDSPGSSSCSQFSYGSREPSVVDLSSPSLTLPRPAGTVVGGRRGSVTQDVEATL